MAVYVVSPNAEVGRVLRDEQSDGTPTKLTPIVDLRSMEDLAALFAGPAGEPRLDLVVLDLDLESNLASCRKLRERASLDGVPIIVVTERDSAASVDLAFEAGASDYLPRPFSDIELRGRVRSELALAQETHARRAREAELHLVTTRLEEANHALRAREEELARELADGLVYQSALIELATLEQPTFAATLRRALRVIARAVGVTRVGYWQLRRSGDRTFDSILCEALYLAEEDRFDGGTVLHAHTFPRYFEALEKGSAVAADDACADERTSEFTDAYLRPNGIGAMLDVPVFVRGALAGVICHEHVGPPRVWRLEEQQFAFSVGQILSLVIETEDRRRAETALLESRAHLATVIETALDAVITMDGRGCIEGWNLQAEVLFGKKRADVLGLELADVAMPGMRELVLKGQPESGGEGRGTRLEMQARNVAGHDFPVEIALASFSLSQEPHFSAFVRDITLRKQSENALRHTATHDALTGLANRAHFIEVVNDHLARRTDNDRVALLFLDLDRFKQVNDTLGHQAGDELLRGIASRIEACLREDDLPARLGGDEFTVLLARVDDEDEARAIGERVLAAIRAPIALSDTSYEPSASVGVVFLSGPRGAYGTADEALKDADAAMYAAKTSGKGRVSVYQLG